MLKDTIGSRSGSSAAAQDGREHHGNVNGAKGRDNGPTATPP